MIRLSQREYTIGFSALFFLFLLLQLVLLLQDSNVGHSISQQWHSLGFGGRKDAIFENDGICDSEEENSCWGDIDRAEQGGRTGQRKYPSLSAPRIWDSVETIPRTRIIGHVPGWTLFENFYAFNKTMYIVTDAPEEIPSLVSLTSNGRPLSPEPEEVARRQPTDADMQIITPESAFDLFGKQALELRGVNWIVNDPPQFIAHYYHFVAEVVFGMWRTYVSQDTEINARGDTYLPEPRRLIFTHTSSEAWRDYSGMNQYTIRAAFPSISIEGQNDWEPRFDVQGTVLLYDRVVFADRAAATTGERFRTSSRSAAEPFGLPGSPFWWAPFRNIVVRRSGLDVEPYMEGQVPSVVITYVNRQGWGRRMLRPEDHNRLVQRLTETGIQQGWEVNIVELNKLSHAEQVKLAARTTIMMGVHGNGLTSLLWMLPSIRSTVFEFFYPQGFALDYEWTARALGIAHYGFWNDHSFTFPNLPQVNYPEGFQGNEIPLDADAVIKVIRSRLNLEQELDD